MRHLDNGSAQRVGCTSTCCSGGEDLLSVVNYLEDQGIAHRDIKPDNIGVGPLGRSDRLHLVLFDFSLSRRLRTFVLGRRDTSIRCYRCANPPDGICMLNAMQRL